jgi:pentatricopeptide repeat protein
LAIGRRNASTAGPQADVNESTLPGSSKPTPYDNTSSASTKGNGPAASLSNMINCERPAQEVWESFLQLYPSKNCPGLSNPHNYDRDLLKYGNIFIRLLHHIIPAWVGPEPTPDLPSPTQVLDKFSELGVHRGIFIEEAIWALLPSLVEVWARPAEQSREMANVSGYMELLYLWDRLFRLYSTQSGRARRSASDSLPPDSPPDISRWEYLPTTPFPTEPVKRNGRGYSNTSIVARVALCLPSYPTTKAPSLSAAILATHRLLEQPGSEVPQDVEKPSRLLVEFFTRLLRQGHTFTTLEQLKYRLGVGKGVSPLAAQKFVDDVSDPSTGLAPKVRRLAGDQHRSEESASVLRDHFIDRIRKSVQLRNEAELRNIWSNMRMAYGYGGSEDNESNASVSQQKAGEKAQGIPNELYTLLLSSFCQFGMANSAVEIWNFMLSHGIRPTIQHWSAMITGCAVARDVAMIDRLWRSMGSLGIEYDAQAWGIYINALFWCGNIDMGLRTLAQMGQNWERAVASQATKDHTEDWSDIGDLPGAPKPNSHILNIALGHLSKMTKSDPSVTQKIFAWASMYGIKPDQYTFNTLLHSELKRSEWQNLNEGLKILQEMEENGVKPNDNTLVMLIMAVMRNKQLASSDRSNLVTSLLSSLEERGVNASGEVYSTIMEGLLNEHGNTAGAQAVMRYMQSRKIPIPSFAYTVLAKNHFRQNPPDIAAVEALLYQIKATDTRVDHYFYDMLVDEYSKLGMVGEAMSALGKMSSLGMKPSWIALMAVVRASHNAGQINRVQEIVHDASSGSGLLVNGIKRSRDEEKFWRLLYELGIPGLKIPEEGLRKMQYAEMRSMNRVNKY